MSPRMSACFFFVVHFLIWRSRWNAAVSSVNSSEWTSKTGRLRDVNAPPLPA